MKFPLVHGKNLNNEVLEFPKDFTHQYNVVLVAFQQWHQQLVNTWVQSLSKIENQRSDFKFYEFPTLAKGYKLMRFVIDGGMRAGIPDASTRDRTVTLYVNKDKFKQTLGISSEATIFLFLVSQIGDVLWFEKGERTLEKESLLLGEIKPFQVPG